MEDVSRVGTAEAAGAAAPTEPADGRRRMRATVAGVVGNTVEWVDWSIYGYFAPLFAESFFPSRDNATDLLATLAVFALAFVMRPVGAAVLGTFADRHGRQKGLALTVLLMAGSSMVMAVTPTYATIGIAAPVILVLTRLVQGFSAGGEFGSSSAFLVESAAPSRRAFTGSWQQVSVGAGGLIAAAIAAVITTVFDEQQQAAYGWRIAFAVCGLLGVVGLWLRTRVAETEQFSQATQEGRVRANPLRVLLRDHPRAALRVFGITIAGTVTYYVWIVYLAQYAQLTTGLPLNQALWANTIAQGVFIAALPLGGKLSDTYGRKPTMLAFAIGFAVLAWPMLALLSDNFWGFLGLSILGMLLIVGYSANCATVMAEQFPAEVRTVGIALPYALAVAAFGGTAPYVITWLFSHHLESWVALYLVIASLIGVAVYATMPETKGKDLT
ncbi:MFS transporter [Streptomyces cucumeris]|uniref:MFS transporter n=1 Tax=Streptomyces cucumeris TaxID=2962890 RepID=UPI003EB7973E